MMDNKILGKHINLRLVEISDADFILKLRTDRGENLSKTSNNINLQTEWIRNYKVREQEKKEYYFIIESNSGDSLGTVRIYDIKKDSFCWGSWIIKKNGPIFASIESALLIYIYGFITLGFKKSHFDVKKQNTKVIKFHLGMGASIINKDEENYYFNYLRQDFLKKVQNYKKFLTDHSKTALIISF